MKHAAPVRPSVRRRELLAGGLLGLLFARSGAQERSAGLQGNAGVDGAREVEVPRYDLDYPDIGYSATATQNRIARLHQQLLAGRRSLDWQASGGYLRALLSALDIDADTQVLVFSRTSLQPELISPQTPRAVYFNDDTYVGFIPGSAHIELMAFDAMRGPVFYTLHNQPDEGGLRRFGGACLTCHDNYSLMGGGVPRVLALSVHVEVPGGAAAPVTGIDVDDRTPIAQRWGGWYVTGRGGGMHRGNRPIVDGVDQQLLRQLDGAERDSMAGVFDTSRYPSSHSDIVALLVLEHQKTVQNLLTRVGLKAVSGMQRLAAVRGALAEGPGALAARQQALVTSLVAPLLDALFHLDAAPLPQGLAAGNGFAARFSRLGPHDRAGRSLRALQVADGRLFRLPLSYVVHTAAFDTLPAGIREAVRTGVRDVLRGADPARSARIPGAERRIVAELLADTRAGFMD